MVRCTHPPPVQKFLLEKGHLLHSAWRFSLPELCSTLLCPEGL